MNILLITNNDLDGVGQVAVNLNDILNKKGHNSKILLLNNFYKKKNVIIIKKHFFKRFFYFFLEFLKKRYREIFTFNNSTINFKSIKDYIYNADVIVIYTLHKFLDFEMLSKIYEAKKIIYFRPLDMELVTGGCHVNILDEKSKICLKFYTGCNNCPKLNKLNFFNISKKLFKKKKIFMNNFRPNILLENEFTKKIYNNSPITKNANNEVIYLSVKDNRIKFIKKNKARKVFNLKSSDKIILFGTFNLDAPHKGGRMIEEIIKMFISYSVKKKNKLFNLNNIKLITFGRKQNFQFKVPEIKWLHLGEIFEDQKLNSLYRAADVFLSPAVGDNGPATIRESILNNLPVIAFDDGEASETIINNVNGYLIKKNNKKLFAKKIYNALYNKNYFFLKNKANENLKFRYMQNTEANTLINKIYSDQKKI